MATVLITGGTGLVGTALTKALVNGGYEVIILTRNASGSLPERGISYAQWNPQQQVIGAEAVAKADYIVHLAGANVADGRWTARRKKEIIDSRVKSGALLVDALKKTPNKVRAVISSSAIGYYGPDGSVPNPRPFTEADPPAHDFLATVVQQWEGAIMPAAELGKRLVVFRIGIVLSREGGAYHEFRKPLKWGLASILGSGRQIVSWIHIDDLVRLFITAIESDGWNGIYNATAPAPVSNKELILQMRKKQSLSIPLPVPSFLLKAVLGEMSIEVLKSTTVSNQKITAQGFVFRFPQIDDAVKDLG